MVVEILGTSKLSSKFQITVSKEVRERFGFDANDVLVFWDDDGRLVLRKSTDRQ
jgi:AbrB family looped-hinge helix DNA binding protein